jgi:hypothetical protein
VDQLVNVNGEAVAELPGTTYEMLHRTYDHTIH